MLIFLFLYQKVLIFKGHSWNFFIGFNKTRFFYEVFKSRKLYIYLVSPFRWPWRRLRKKSLYFFLFLRENGSKETKNLEFCLYLCHLCYCISLQHFPRHFFLHYNKQGSLMYITFHGYGCPKMARIFLDFKNS